MAQEIDTFAAHKVRVVELEMADDLGQPGPSISTFGQDLAGSARTNPDWTFGVASAGLTTTYDPGNYLDIYYLVDATGHITYVNGSPASTMGQLLAHVAAPDRSARADPGRKDLRTRHDGTWVAASSAICQPSC